MLRCAFLFRKQVKMAQAMLQHAKKFSLFDDDFDMKSTPSLPKSHKGKPAIRVELMTKEEKRRKKESQKLNKLIEAEKRKSEKAARIERRQAEKVERVRKAAAAKEERERIAKKKRETKEESSGKSDVKFNIQLTFRGGNLHFINAKRVDDAGKDVPDNLEVKVTFKGGEFVGIGTVKSGVNVLCPENQEIFDGLAAANDKALAEEKEKWEKWNEMINGKKENEKGSDSDVLSHLLRVQGINKCD